MTFTKFFMKCFYLRQIFIWSLFYYEHPNAEVKFKKRQKSSTVGKALPQHAAKVESVFSTTCISPLSPTGVILKHRTRGAPSTGRSGPKSKRINRRLCRFFHNSYARELHLTHHVSSHPPHTPPQFLPFSLSHAQSKRLLNTG